ncbi:MAG TPA: TonB family protein [bacterium]|nr:TonB family protein [bacterium]
MSDTTLRSEFDLIRRRTRQSYGASAVVHVLLLIAFLLTRTASDELEGVTEITWIEAAPEPSPPAQVEVARAAPEPGQPAMPSPRKEQKQFVREKPADVAPLQDLAAARDRMRDRLESMRKQNTDTRTQIAALTDPAPAVQRPRPSGLEEGELRAERIKLSRGNNPAAPPPLQLTRTATKGRPLAPQKLQPNNMARPEASPAAPASGISREVLAGVTLTGPVANRELLNLETPEYPDWAKADAIEGSVRLYFVVLPDGRVKENVLVQATSGYEEFDRNATDALLAWRFEPLTGGAVGEQWGSITLHYRLGDVAHN